MNTSLAGMHHTVSAHLSQIAVDVRFPETPEEAAFNRIRAWMSTKAEKERTELARKELSARGNAMVKRLKKLKARKAKFVARINELVNGKDAPGSPPSLSDYESDEIPPAKGSEDEAEDKERKRKKRGGELPAEDDVVGTKLYLLRERLVRLKEVIAKKSADFKEVKAQKQHLEAVESTLRAETDSKWEAILVKEKNEKNSSMNKALGQISSLLAHDHTRDYLIDLLEFNKYYRTVEHGKLTWMNKNLQDVWGEVSVNLKRYCAQTI